MWRRPQTPGKPSTRISAQFEKLKWFLDKQINVTEFGDVDIDKVCKFDLEHFGRLLEKPIHRACFGHEEVKGLADTI